MTESGPVHPALGSWQVAQDWFPLMERFSSKKMAFPSASSGVRGAAGWANATTASDNRAMTHSSPSLSVLTGQPVCLTQIRAHRPKPDLQAAHLATVRAAAARCATEV